MAVSVLGWRHEEFWRSTPRCLLSQVGIRTGKRADGTEAPPVTTRKDIEEIMSW